MFVAGIIADILFIESVGDHVCLHLSEMELITRSTLKKYVLELADHSFHQIHKTLVVNQNHVKQLNKLGFGDNEIILSNNASLKAIRCYKSVISSFVS
ncbi:MAG: LytTR family transcriptional regulator [Gammaproteobacteria bacterium]|nr:LytTR family transcriptional regulator [Gammaproteobacteria bacterium]